MRFLLLGAPGVGKGTQGTRLSEYYQIAKLSTGEILRKEIASGSDLGKSIAQVMGSGMLVPDVIVEKIVANHLIFDIECKKGFVLDGFPRTVHQAQALTEMLNHLPKDQLFVINITVSIEELITRLKNRVICQSCGYTFHKQEVICPKCGSTDYYQRDDDKEDVLKQRFEIYNQLTKQLIDYYSNDHGLISVNGLQSIETVFNSIINAINEKILEF